MVVQKKVTTIPASLTRFTATPITELKKRRVAGYARVSTDHDDQFTSYAAQIDYYTNYIKSRDDWEFVEVYTDEGITGTSVKHREGFKRMVADALAGKIDLIVTTPGGKEKWSISTVKSILSNEKYKGDALLQKSYTVDFLTKKTKVNEGEIPQYYVEDNHEAIIDPEVFEMVQREMAKRGKGKKYHSGVHAFSTNIKCGECGSWYGSKVWHSNSKYRKTIWQCNH